MKKKVLVMIALLVVTGTFFSFTVNAATSPQTTEIYSIKSASVSVNGVSIAVSATQFNPHYGTASNNIAYDSMWVLNVSLVVSNISSDYKYISSLNPRVQMTMPTNSSGQELMYEYYTPYNSVVSIENYSPDLMLSYSNANGYIDVRPSADWGYRYGFIVPPNTRMCAVANIYFPAKFDATNQTIIRAILDNVSFVYNPEVQTTTDVPAGSPAGMIVYLSAIKEDLEDADIGLPAINDLLAGIESQITVIHNDIINTVHTDLSVLHNDITTVNNTLNGTIHSDLGSIYNGVADIRTILQGNNTTNDNINNDSASLKTQSDNVHSQEQAYFTQNSQAIQATGLGNYQIGTVEGNGIASVSSDFTSLWNALNGWTAVYIFSLTLGLALTILRHAPNAISRRQRRKQE